MQRFPRRFAWMVLVVMLSACTTKATQPSTSVISTPEPTTELVNPTAVPVDTTAEVTLPMSLDADGYHVIGDPAAPIVLTDYSDYF
ncbi:MAG: hypothetical protein RLY87_1870 [Chloroflexota bacterium]|jgi:PBP1b-binding outer membrane lipoprotein LpoB